MFIGDDRLLNFIIALVSGSVGCRYSFSFKNIDIWDCEPWMEFLRINYMPTIFSMNPKIRLHQKYK